MRLRINGRVTTLAVRFLAVSIAIALVLACSSCVKKSTSFSAEKQEEMERVLDQVMSEENAPGVVVGVWVPDRGNWVKAKGEADIDTGRDIEKQDRMRIASNTKPFTATVILQLADEGKLSLDDKLEKFVTGVPYGNEMTIRQVCNMMSGVFSFTEDETFQEEFEKDPLIKLTPQQEVDIALKHEPYFPPGEGWHYSDTNYELLGMIIEKVTGNRAGNEITRRIIEPLGLENTLFPRTPGIPGQHSHGYIDREGEGLVDYTEVNPDIPWTAGAMISNLYDMKTWAKALAEGKLVSKEMHEQQFGWVDMGGGAGKYGLGVTNIHGFIGHHGAIFGFNSVFFYLPEEDATIVVFVNKSVNESNESSKIFVELAKIVFPEMFQK